MVFKIVNFPLRDENFIIPCLTINVSDVRQALMLERRLADSGFCEAEDGDCFQKNRLCCLVSKKLVSFQFVLFSVNFPSGLSLRNCWILLQNCQQAEREHA